MLKPTKKKKKNPIIWTTQDFILLLLVVAIFTMIICTQTIVAELDWVIIKITDEMNTLDIQYIERLELMPDEIMVSPEIGEDI